MVRQVTFRIGTTPKYILGRYRIGRTAEFLFTTENHDGGGGIGLNYNNIEITVPDNWGSQTQSPVTIELPQSEDDSNAVPVAYYKSMAEPFELNIIMKVNGNLQTYYQLRDRFLLAFGHDDIELCIHEPGVGNRYVLGYISNMSMDEFRAQHNATSRATFVPITPWYRKYATSSSYASIGAIVGEPISGLSGHGVVNNGSQVMVDCTYLSCYKMSNVEELVVRYCDPGDSSQLLWDVILPSDIGEGVEYISIFNDKILGLSGSVTSEILGEYAIPAGLYGFSVNSTAMVYELGFTTHVPSPKRLAED